MIWSCFLLGSQLATKSRK